MSALRFALAVIRRRRARTGRPAPVPASPARAPRTARSGSVWHLHLQGSVLRVEPRLSLAVSVAAPPLPPPAAPAGAEPAAERVREVLALFRRHDHTRERRAVELRVVRASERLTERCVTRAARIDGARPEAAVAAAAAPATVAMAPPVELRLSAPPAVAGRAEDRRPDVRGALAAFGAPEPVASAPAPIAVAPDVERLADSVLDVIDRRVVAHRERLGRS